MRWNAEHTGITDPHIRNCRTDVAARTLPTANAAIPPTPVPTMPSAFLATAPSRAIVVTNTAPSASATALWETVNAVPTSCPNNGFCYGAVDTQPRLLANSWVAFSPAIHVRFFAPPSLVDTPEFNNDHRYSLGSPSNVYDFEALEYTDTPDSMEVISHRLGVQSSSGSADHRM